MVDLLDKHITRLACFVALLAAMTAIGSLVAGFINMATFLATKLHASVGIWCGLVMILHISTGVFLLGSRKYSVGILYLFSNVICLGITVYGVIIAYDYYQSFSDFHMYNKNGRCFEKFGNCGCINAVGKDQVEIKKGFTVSSCTLYSFGEGLWSTLFVLTVLNAVWSLIGFLAGLIALGGVCAKSADRNLYPQSTYRQHLYTQFPITMERGRMPTTTERNRIPTTTDRSRIPTTTERSRMPVTTGKSGMRVL